MPSNKRISCKKKNGGGFKSIDELIIPGGNYYATLGHVFQSDGFQRVVKNFRVMRPRSNASSKKSNRTYNILKLYNKYLKKKSILEIGEEYIAYIKNKQEPENKLFDVFTKYLRRAIPRFKVQTLKKLSRRYSNTNTSLHDSKALQFRDKHIMDEERNSLIMRMQSAQQPQFSRPQPQSQFSRPQPQFSRPHPQPQPQFSRSQPQFSRSHPQFSGPHPQFSIPEQPSNLYLHSNSFIAPPTRER